MFFILALWALISEFVFVDSFLFPSPTKVIFRFFELLFKMEIVPDIISTLLKIFTAISIGSAFGFISGVVISLRTSVYDAISPVMDFFRSIPGTALFPLFLLIFGAGDQSNILLAAWVCALYLSLHVSKGFRSTSEAALITAKSLKKTELETIIHVRFKEALPLIFVGFRIATSLTVVLVIVTEMFVGTKNGIGKVLIDASYTYDISKLYSMIFAIGFIGYLLNHVILKLEQTIVHWHGK